MPESLQQVQRNVFPGFDVAYQHFLFFKVNDLAALTLLWEDLADHLASAGALIDASAASPAVNLAVTFPPVSFVYRDCARLLDEAFRSGMAARADLLGDTASERWLFGGGGAGRWTLSLSSVETIWRNRIA